MMLAGRISDLERSRNMRLNLLKHKFRSTNQSKEFEKCLSDLKSASEQKWETYDRMASCQKWVETKREASVGRWWNDLD